MMTLDQRKGGEGMDIRNLPSSGRRAPTRKKKKTKQSGNSLATKREEKRTSVRSPSTAIERKEKTGHLRGSRQKKNK